MDMKVGQSDDMARIAKAAPHSAALSKAAAGAVGGVVWITPIICLVAVTAVVSGLYMAGEGIIPLWVSSIITAISIFMVYTPLHESVHGNISGRNKKMAWLDVWVGRTAGFLMSVPYGPHKTIHLTHHRETNDPDLDPDHWVKSSFPPMILLRCMTAVFGYLIYCIRHWQNPEMRKAFWGSIGAIVMTVIILTGVGQVYSWHVPVFGYAIPALTATTVLAFLFDWIVHHPHDAQGRFVNTRVLVNDGPLDKLVTILDLQQNYHGVHHAFPKIPFTKYRQFYHAHRQDFDDAGLPVMKY